MLNLITHRFVYPINDKFRRTTEANNNKKANAAIAEHRAMHLLECVRAFARFTVVGISSFCLFSCGCL